eukprot:5060320-Alexandrium_andersonii.AAC.1
MRLPWCWRMVRLRRQSWGMGSLIEGARPPRPSHLELLAHRSGESMGAPPARRTPSPVTSGAQE